MARLARVIAVDIPHYITQRGNARGFVLQSDTDRRVYLQILGRYYRLRHLDLPGCCLMFNHLPLIAIPHTAESLPR